MRPSSPSAGGPEGCWCGAEGEKCRAGDCIAAAAAAGYAGRARRGSEIWALEKNGNIAKNNKIQRKNMFLEVLGVFLVSGRNKLKPLHHKVFSCQNPCGVMVWIYSFQLLPIFFRRSYELGISIGPAQPTLEDLKGKKQIPGSHQKDSQKIRIIDKELRPSEQGQWEFLRCEQH